MTARYTKSPHAKAQQVAGHTFLISTASPLAFELNDSGAVLWEALDHFDDREDLESLVIDARPGLAPSEVRALVRAFLDALVEHGLATVHRLSLLRKNPDLTIEQVGDELMVLSRADRRVHLMNDTAALLWGALDHFPTVEALAGLLAEAWPARPRDEIAGAIEEFVHRLLALGLLTEDA